MTNLFQQGSELIEKVHSQSLSVSVTYRRGTDSVTLSATPIFARRQATDESGFIIEYEQPDFVLSTADLILDESQTIPELGDEIELTRNGKTETYEVAKGPSDSHWRYADPYGYQIRVHTIHTGSTE